MNASADAGRPGGDHDPLDQHVRALLHQLAVLEGAGLGLVRVADQVLASRALGQEGDLLAHRKAGAAATAQTGSFELGEHISRIHREGLAQRLIAAAALVALTGGQARLVDVGEQQHRPLGGRPAHCSPLPHSAVCIGWEGYCCELAAGSATSSRASCFSGSTGCPLRTSSSNCGTSAIWSGPT